MVQDASCEIDRRHQNHIPACEELVVTHATHFAEKLQVTSFGGSYGWFKACYSIKQYNKAGEANSAPLETLNDERVILQEVIGGYDLCDIDETALFWSLEPSKTLSDHLISGT
ncbi:5237_t:CDS:2 [Entrophospora sp. SA101]|nr:5237_t:CDS:2 [Entrophospora sp. SA101]